MKSEDIRKIVEAQIGTAWDTTNLHGVDLRKSLVKPERIQLIARNVKDGELEDKPMEVWIVLIEDPETQTGYRIVANDDGSEFGLASEGFKEDKHPVFIGWYGDFLTTYEAM
jgi:hypothetical protein